MSETYRELRQARAHLQPPVDRSLSTGAHGTNSASPNISNSDGHTVSVQSDPIQIIDTDSAPLPGSRGININVANDEGVQYDVPDSVVASNTVGIVYPYSPNTYFVSFRQDGGTPVQKVNTFTAK